MFFSASKAQFLFLGTRNSLPDIYSQPLDIVEVSPYMEFNTIGLSLTQNLNFKLTCVSHFFSSIIPSLSSPFSFFSFRSSFSSSFSSISVSTLSTSFFSAPFSFSYFSLSHPLSFSLAARRSVFPDIRSIAEGRRGVSVREEYMKQLRVIECVTCPLDTVQFSTCEQCEGNKKKISLI